MGIELKPKIDMAVCPICGQPNSCAMAVAPNVPKCWCAAIEFPKELLDQVPEKALHQACICRNCFDRYMMERNPGC